MPRSFALSLRLPVLAVLLLLTSACFGAVATPTVTDSLATETATANSTTRAVTSATPAPSATGTATVPATNSPTRPPAMTATATTRPTETATPVPPATSTVVASPVPTTPPAPTVPSVLTIPPPAMRGFPIERESKLGIGVYASGGHVMQALQRMEPGVILLQEPSVEFAAEVRRNFPRAFIIGKRFQTAGQPLDNPSARGAAFADYVAQLAVPLKGTVDAWQSYNEPIGGGDIAQYQAWNAFQVAFAERLQGHYGISAVAGNDPAGAMQPEDYPRYFGDAIRASDYFGVHLYSSGKPPFRLNEPGAEWYILRYRKIHEALEAAGIHDVKMIVTESGHGEGWRNKISPELVAEDFYWLTAEMEKDSYVIGHAIFGFFDEGGNWGEFNLPNIILDYLRGYRPGAVQ